MAKNSNKFDLNKGSGKKFDLNKANGNKFDLSKDSENEFDLSKEETEVITPATPNDTTSTSESKKKESSTTTATSNDTTSTSEPNKSKLMYIIGALILIALLIWGISKCGGTDSVEPDDPNVPAQETIATPSDEPTTTTPAVEETPETPATGSDEVIDSTEGSSTSETTQTPVTSEETTAPSAPVQQEVSDVARPTEETRNAPVTTANIEQKALQVIRGDFGNGQTRKNNLGSEYDAIQQHVNELYRKGLVD